jgi:predicted nucleotide-binding protein
MAKVPATDLASRFCGKNGPKAVQESLTRQQLVGGQAAIAKALQVNGSVAPFQRGDTITEQGSADTDIYFLLCGSVKILVNGYEVAVRQAGTHFGEMAAMDYTAKRSASVVAEDEVVVLRVPQDQFMKIASRYSSVWKELARILAIRLRERSKFFRSRNPRPIVFIGSSSEGKVVAEALKALCEKKLRRAIDVRLWSDGVFQASQTVLEDLLQTTEHCDFAVLVLTPDDKTKSRGTVKDAPRDNVVYELGLFTGALGRERSLIVVPSQTDIKIPTDLLGVTTLRYTPRKSTSALMRQLESAVTDIVARIKQHGPR